MSDQQPQSTDPSPQQEVPAEQLLGLLMSAAGLAPMSKQDHIKCEQAANTLAKKLARLAELEEYILGE